MRTLFPAILLLAVVPSCSEYELTAPSEDLPEGPGPLLRVDPTFLDFGEIELDASADAVVTVSNVGSGPLEIISLQLFDNTGTFQITALGEDVLEAGAFADFVVTYTPLDSVPVEAIATVFSDAVVDADVDVTLLGAGAPPTEYDVDVLITADNSWVGWLDGQPITATNQDDWTHSDLIETTLPSGEHAITVHATDVSSVISGLAAIVTVDGIDTHLTGDGSWKMSSTTPPTDWIDPSFDDSAWGTASVCTSQDTWGTYWPADYIAAGADWIWWTSNCRDLQQAWFRMTFTLP